MSVVSVVCYQAEVSAASWSLVQSSPYRLFCVVVCDLETSWIWWPWPTCGKGGTSCCSRNKHTILYNSESSLLYSGLKYHFGTIVYSYKYLFLSVSFLTPSSLQVSGPRFTVFARVNHVHAYDINDTTSLMLLLNSPNKVHLLQLFCFRKATKSLHSYTITCFLARMKVWLSWKGYGFCYCRVEEGYFLGEGVFLCSTLIVNSGL